MARGTADGSRVLMGTMRRTRHRRAVLPALALLLLALPSPPSAAASKVAAAAAEVGAAGELRLEKDDSDRSWSEPHHQGDTNDGDDVGSGNSSADGPAAPLHDGDRRVEEHHDADDERPEATLGVEVDVDEDEALGTPEEGEEYRETWDEDFDEDEEEDDDSPYVAPDDAGRDGADYFNVTEANGPDADDGADLGVPQLCHRQRVDAFRSTLAAARGYLETEVMVDPFYEPARGLCRNQHELCAHWAAVGECDANPGYMRRSCAPVCRSCELLHVKTRCPPPDPAGPLAIYPGDLDRLFRRLLADPAFATYAPRALSRPDFADGDTPETADYALGMWLVVLENIVNVTEAARLIELASAQGYERSSDVGEELEDGTYGDDVNEDRTSTNAWCEEDCLEDPVARKVMGIIEHVTGIPEANQEPLQQLRYEVGQFYNAHNDFIEYQRERPAGPRILTFFLYLNDVEEGGETRFPRIGLSVKPKLGRAVLWPSVYDHDPSHANDLRSDHQALPVVKGIKYGANAWIHQGNIKDDTLDCQ